MAKKEEEWEIALRVTGDKIPSEFARELKFIGPMSRRTDYVVRTAPVVLEEMGDPPRYFKIGTVSLDVAADRDLEPFQKRVRGVDYLLHHLKPEAFNKLETLLLDNVRTAAQQGCQFICANELGYPWCSPLRKGYSQKSNAIQNELLQLSREYGCYIVGGTFHCSKTFHNLAMLFSPSVPRTQQGHAKNPRPHAKKTSAHSVGEIIRVPYNRDVRVYVTKYGRIAILICLDSYDPSLVIGLVRAKHLLKNRDDDIDIVFVPAYNPHPGSGNPAAQDLSYLLGNIVVHVNTQEFGGTHPTVYMCGEPVTGKRNFKKVTNELRVYTINVRRYKGKSDKLLSARSSFFRRVYGVQTSHRRAI